MSIRTASFAIPLALCFGAILARLSIGSCCLRRNRWPGSPAPSIRPMIAMPLWSA